MKVTERLYLTADAKRLVPEGHQDAAFLYAIPGQTITDAVARQLGVLKDDSKRDKASFEDKEAAPVEDKEAAGPEDKAAEKPEEAPTEERAEDDTASGAAAGEAAEAKPKKKGGLSILMGKRGG